MMPDQWIMATMDRWTIRAETFLDDFWITRLASNRSEQVDNVGIPLPMAEPQIGPCGVVRNQQARICEIFNLPSSLVLQSCNLLVPVPLIIQLSLWVELKGSVFNWPCILMLHPE